MKGKEKGSETESGKKRVGGCRAVLRLNLGGTHKLSVHCNLA